MRISFSYDDLDLFCRRSALPDLVKAICAAIDMPLLLMLEYDRTARGSAYATFKDHYGNDCSIQKSSAAAVDAIWLGLDDGTSLHRMHLTQDHVRMLLPSLLYFVEHGELPDSEVQVLYSSMYL